jgi:amyloid beta precursor protein binding protein 1
VDDLVKEDASVLQTLMMEWFESMGIILTAEQTEMASNVAYETARYGSSQLNPVGAILGGIMSQELIKIITRQYTPMQNRLIYDGVRGTTQQLF